MAGVGRGTRLFMYSIALGLGCISGLIWGFGEIWLMMLIFFFIFLAYEIINYFVIRKRLNK